MYIIHQIYIIHLERLSWKIPESEDKFHVLQTTNEDSSTNYILYIFKKTKTVRQTASMHMLQYPLLPHIL